VRARRAAGAAVLAALLALSGCGSDRLDPSGETPAREDTAPPSERSSALVDATQEPPLVNAFDVDEKTGEYLMSTNQGFFRIDPETSKVSEVEGTVGTPTRSAPIGNFLAFLPVDGGRRLIGSGHPDSEALPEFLGFIESEDGGRTWTVLARLGEADLHKLIEIHDRLYAYDAVLGAILVSEDGGKTFSEHFTPRGLITDFVVDPADPDHILAASETQVFRSTDGGNTWRPLLVEAGVRLAWPERDRLLRADRDGSVSVSRDGGRQWERTGEVDGEPYRLHARSAQNVDVALATGAIARTRDGGATWERVFTPGPAPG
jgi:hypothetical protein